MHRREFLGSAALSVVRPESADAVADAPFPGLIVREREPANLEFPMASLSAWLVPSDRFFVRSHFAVPKIDPAKWTLKVEGAVARPGDYTLEQLRQLPTATMPLTIECAGNGRVFLSPKVRGVAWQTGAVGNADWTGLRLGEILSRAGVSDKAVDVVLEGADRGVVADDPKSPGEIAFARSLPIRKAMNAEVLLAHSMNGAPLTPEHGAPLRAVVGGWYGMASVKWLTRIVVLERQFEGFWQTFDYSVFQRERGLPVMTPIQAMALKSVISRPALGEQVPRNAEFLVHGAAWAGENNIDRVELSVDGGKTWRDAALNPQSAPFCWRLWSFNWRTPATPGNVTLMARATDSRGRTQPMTRDPDLRTYVIHHVVPQTVSVT